MISFFVLVGTALLPIWKNIPVKPSDVIFGIALLMSVFWLPGALSKTPFARNYLRALAASAALFFFLIVATVVGAEKYGIALDVVGATALFRYVLWNILGVAVYCLAKRVPHFSRQMLYALLAPALLLPLAFIPALHTLVYSSGDRFEGFVDGQQPNILATDSAIACAIAWPLLCHAVIRRLPKGRQLGYLTLFLCLLTVLWLTQSRSQLIAAFLALLVGSVLVLIGYADATQRRRIIFRTVLLDRKSTRLNSSH